jgi:hypothetical protein
MSLIASPAFVVIGSVSVKVVKYYSNGIIHFSYKNYLTCCIHHNILGATLDFWLKAAIFHILYSKEGY